MKGPETKICVNCKQSFVIEPDDFVFYEKINVPSPTWCPECRLIRRFTWIENRSLYHDTCDLCGKDMLSMYHPSSPYPVYCSPCWWSDAWDPMSYGIDLDFKKPFLEQFKELHRTVPRQASTVRNSVNCRYCNQTINSKNCYLNFGSYQAQDCFYCFGALLSKNCLDADLGMNMDHAYESRNSDSVFNVTYTYVSEECIDSSFLFDCRGCTECFGGVNLRNKKYILFNEQLTKKDYREKMKEWDLGSYAKSEEAKRRFRELYLTVPQRYAHITNSVGVTGEYIRNTKNCKTCFAALTGVEDCKFIHVAGLGLKDSYDAGAGGENSQLIYETTGILSCERVNFSKGPTNCHDLEYCDIANNSQYFFGCVALRSKSYCILNKQYTKEEYERLIPKIKEHMTAMPYVDSHGRTYPYGERFPSEISPWAYNESLAQDWFPLTKEEAAAKGYSWRDEEKRDYTITMRPEQLPDHIKDTPDSILNETIGCMHAVRRGGCNEACSTAFRIIPEELQFYRQMNVALPRLCPNCRYRQRLQWRNPSKLWHRKCAKCPNEFETTYAPDRKEMIYCQECYNAEFL